MAKAIINGQTIFGNVEMGQGGSSMHDYSTDEQIVGTWIDGSTIYEKTFELSSEIEVSNTSWTATGITLTDIQKVISVEILGTANYQGGGLANVQNDILNIQTTRNSPAYCKYIVLRYTKSST